MPQKPEKNPLENIGLDFTKPKDKLKDIDEKIAAAKRGIILAQSLPTPDEARTQTLEVALRGFEATKKELLAEMPTQEFFVPSPEEEDAFSRAVGTANDGVINKMEKRGF